MARAGRNGPGYASLIIFIVLCLALIGAYVPLAMAFAKRANTLDQLQQSIKANLEDVGSQLGVQGDWSRADQGQAAYDDRFFRTIQEAAEKGVKSDQMKTLLGMTGDDPAQAMIAFVNNDVENPEGAKDARAVLDPKTEHDLKWYIKQKVAEIHLKEQRRQNARQAEERWQEEARRAGDTLEKAETAYREKSQIYVANTARAKSDYKQNVDKYEAQWSQANKEMKDWSNRYQLQRKEALAEKEALEKKIRDLQNDVEVLKAELAKKKPKPVVITKGKVLKAEALDKLAIINMGKASGIAVGERFIVMRPIIGGEYVPKGVLKVIQVDEHISRADIIEQDEKYLVMQDDVIHREKQFLQE